MQCCRPDNLACLQRFYTADETNDTRNSWLRSLSAARKILMTNTAQRYKHHENNIVLVKHHIQDMYGIIPRTRKCNTNNEHWCILGNLIALLTYNGPTKLTKHNCSPAIVCQAWVAVRFCLPIPICDVSWKHANSIFMTKLATWMKLLFRP